MEPHSEDEISEALKVISFFSDILSEGPEEYSTIVPVPISHAKYHAFDRDELHEYARTTVTSRMMLALADTRARLYNFVELYLHSIKLGNPHGMILATRSCIELFAYYHQLMKSIIARKGTMDERGDKLAGFLKRVVEVESFLIKYSYGSRSPVLQERRELHKGMLSKLREVDEDDMSLFESGNVMNKISKFKKDDSLSRLVVDYGTLSGYVHPSGEQSGLHQSVSTTVADAVSISRKSHDSTNIALQLTAVPMSMCVTGLMNDMNTNPPFGMGDFIFATPECSKCGMKLATKQGIERKICRLCLGNNTVCAICNKKLSNKDAKQRGTCFSCFKQGAEI